MKILLIILSLAGMQEPFFVTEKKLPEAITEQQCADAAFKEGLRIKEIILRQKLPYTVIINVWCAERIKPGIKT